MFNRDLHKGSAELLVLTLLEARARHGYELGKLIEERSKGQIRFRIGSLYPILFRWEDRGLIAGRWMEKPGERRRRCYRLTPAGRKFLKAQRNAWEEFVATINQIVRRAAKCCAAWRLTASYWPWPAGRSESAHRWQ
jgi:PadR family transcriptional regulator, regulatory protein PadR